MDTETSSQCAVGKRNPASLVNSDRILLPPIEKRLQLPSTTTFYGADRILNSYCGQANESIPENFSWQHGWCCRQRQNIDPIVLVKEPTIEPAKTYLVARSDEANYLQSNGIKSKAIGLPFVYAQATTIGKTPSPRIPNSLLVMPAHSLEYTQHQWKFDEYARQIADLAHRFDRVAACIHPACVRKGYWLPQFERLGIECVIGADAFDANGLARIKTLFSQFEFMTTNMLGSHVVYAAATGVRVSIFGDYAEYREADFANSRFYQLHPQVLKPMLDMHSYDVVKSTYPDFFCDPHLARRQLNWAALEIGESNRQSPAELRRLFGWDGISQTRRRLKLFSRAISIVPERLVKKILGRV